PPCKDQPLIPAVEISSPKASHLVLTKLTRCDFREPKSITHRLMGRLPMRDTRGGMRDKKGRRHLTFLTCRQSQALERRMCGPRPTSRQEQMMGKNDSN